ncbi:MAG: NAD(P)/FAD-dependent oxidoreductase [Peptostreptococcaceae bacterium]
MKIIVIGGGPSGIMASITASKNHSVTLIDKNAELGRKLKLTGGGRCNITNNRDIEDFFDKIVTNKKFLYSSLYSFTNLDLLDYFDKNNLEYKVEFENDQKIYTKSDKAEEVIETLRQDLVNNNVEIMYNTEVTDLIIEEDTIVGVRLNNSKVLKCDKVIIATGGHSYPNTGSDGSMHKILESYHKITDIYPALCPLVTKEAIIKKLQGVSMKDVLIYTKVKKKKISMIGDMIFTHFGLSGPCVLKFSSHINKLLSNGEISIHIDFLKNFTEDEIRTVLKEDLNKSALNNLKKILPQNFSKILLESVNLETKKSKELNKADEEIIIKLIKEFTVTVLETKGIKASQVTSGGVSVREVNSSNLESKNIKNMYFCGEVLDVDCETGGYNLQVAFSSGFLAGSSV